MEFIKITMNGVTAGEEKVREFNRLMAKGAPGCYRWIKLRINKGGYVVFRGLEKYDGTVSLEYRQSRKITEEDALAWAFSRMMDDGWVLITVSRAWEPTREYSVTPGDVRDQSDMCNGSDDEPMEEPEEYRLWKERAEGSGTA